MEVLFFCLFVLLIYPYGLYPMVVVAWAWGFGKEWQQGEVTPKVSIIISVFNEEQVVREKIKNSLQLDYPAHLVEIVVSSDGSNDATNDIVASFDDPRVTLRRFHERAGKTACLNRVVPKANGEIILFTDANSMLPVDTLQKLVRNFADPEVGLVTGWTKYRTADGSEETSGAYSRLERHIKVAESCISSCVGADGAIFAIRKDLYLPLRDEDINDFVIPLNVVGLYRRVVIDPEVYCVEEPTSGGLGEFRRQTRITTRTLGAIRRSRHFLNPLRFGSFAFFLVSHKLLRFLVPFCFVALLLSGLYLWPLSPLVRFILIGQVLFITAGVVGLLRPTESKAVNLSKFFLLTISAQALGWLRFITGKTDTMWTPQR